MKMRLLVAYDGTPFAGWQEQLNLPTIQGSLNEVLARLEGGRVTTYAAARTDKGVHAEGQVVHFQSRREWNPRGLRRALNAHLPAEIRIKDVEPADPLFHAGFDVHAKTYRYRLVTSEVPDPLLSRYAWHYPYPFDESILERELTSFHGTHDFVGFTVEERDTQTTQRTILSTWLVREGDRLDIYIRGKGFLRYQVRTMVSGVLDVVRGRLAVATVAELIATRHRRTIGAPAPAKGLTLVKVEYYHRPGLQTGEAEGVDGEERSALA
ncbi:MAG: tRNA pseudouridine(38-40) synthase TruA [Blastocatellia bacterium]